MQWVKLQYIEDAINQKTVGVASPKISMIIIIIMQLMKNNVCLIHKSNNKDNCKNDN